MIMCYNFFVGMCSRCSGLIQLIKPDWYKIYNTERKKLFEVILDYV